MEEKFEIINEEKALEQANKLVTQAEKKLTTKSFFETIFGTRSSKIENARELYETAGRLYKLAKKWQEAGDTFLKVANMQSQNSYEVACNLISAANCYKKHDVGKAINCILRAINIYLDLGKFIQAASNHEKIAQLYETATFDLTSAVQHYEQAADYYKGEESDTAANRCLLKAAYYYSKEFCEYMKAIEIYEEVASSEINSSLLKYSVKTYFLQAALCYVCLDVVSAEKAIEKYLELFPSFTDTREYAFIKKIVKCVYDENVDEYTQAVANYDTLSRLDNWFVAILLRIKQKISQKMSLC